MRKLLALVLALSLVFALAACGSKTEEPEDVTVEDVVEEVEASDLAYIIDKGTLVVGITDFAPMDYRDENGEWTGFDAEFARLVAAELGVDVEFVEIDWDGKIMELDSNAIDCVWNGMTITDEVKNGMNVTDAYVINAQVVVAAADKVASIASAADLEGLNLVAEAGSAGEEAIVDAGFECVEVSTQADALLEVASGSADACVIDLTMANAMTGEGTSYADLAKGVALTEEEYGIGFRKGSDATEAVNAIIANLKADGALAALAEKYELTLAE